MIFAQQKKIKAFFRVNFSTKVYFIVRSSMDWEICSWSFISLSYSLWGENVWFGKSCDCQLWYGLCCLWGIETFFPYLLNPQSWQLNKIMPCYKGAWHTDSASKLLEYKSNQRWEACDWLVPLSKASINTFGHVSGSKGLVFINLVYWQFFCSDYGLSLLLLLLQVKNDTESEVRSFCGSNITRIFLKFQTMSLKSPRAKHENVN